MAVITFVPSDELNKAIVKDSKAKKANKSKIIRAILDKHYGIEEKKLA